MKNPFIFQLCLKNHAKIIFFQFITQNLIGFRGLSTNANKMITPPVYQKLFFCHKRNIFHCPL